MNPIPIKQQLPFTYVVDTAAIPANGNAAVLLILGDDSEFDLYTFTAATSQDTNSQTILNNFSVLVRDVTTASDMSNAPVQRFNLAGLVPNNVMGQPRAIRFTRKRQIQFQFINLTANPLTIQLSLIGYKIFTSGM